MYRRLKSNDGRETTHNTPICATRGSKHLRTRKRAVKDLITLPIVFNGSCEWERRGRPLARVERAQKNLSLSLVSFRAYNSWYTCKLTWPSLVEVIKSARVASKKWVRYAHVLTRESYSCSFTSTAVSCEGICLILAALRLDRCTQLGCSGPTMTHQRIRECYAVCALDISQLSSRWEPEGNLNNCKRLLDSFWDDIGIDNDDYPEGYTVHATPTWISQCICLQ